MRRTGGRSRATGCRIGAARQPRSRDRAYSTARSVPAAMAGTSDRQRDRGGRPSSAGRPAAAPTPRPPGRPAGARHASRATRTGYETRVRTSDGAEQAADATAGVRRRTAPATPAVSPRGPKNARNANPTTYDGIASGIAVRTAHARRPGRSVRVVSHAIGTPTRDRADPDQEPPAPASPATTAIGPRPERGRRRRAPPPREPG